MIESFLPGHLRSTVLWWLLIWRNIPKPWKHTSWITLF